VEPATLTQEVREELSAVLAKWYREAPDGGTHNAAGWALRQWKVTPPEIEPTQRPVDGRGWFVNRTGMTLVEVPPGAAVSKQACLVITRPFFMSDREVSVALFRQFVADPGCPAEQKPARWPGPSGGLAPFPECPANNVSRWDMLLFCNWLSAREGRRPCYQRGGTAANGWECDFQADGYRLPTEAERDHANRAGSTTVFFFGDDSKWLPSYAHVAALVTAPGASKLPNRWGLFDMVGNVWEMCWDGYGELKGTDFDPTGPRSDGKWIWRGGARDSGSYDTPSDFRFGAGAGPGPSLGFRVVCRESASGPSKGQAEGEERQRRIAACTRALASLPDNRALLQARSDLFLHSGRWKEAAADRALIYEMELGDDIEAMRGAALFLYAGDTESYRRHRRALLAKFKDTQSPISAERVCRACLLAPSGLDDLRGPELLSEVALRANEGHWIFRYTRLARAMVAYRAGKFEEALDWLAKCRAPGALGMEQRSQCMAWCFEAMAHRRLNQEAPARKALETARRLMEKEFADLQKGSVGSEWHGVLMSWVVYREAEKVVAGTP
jgi:formylglycine-generating enzyme required for sulfatase activity